MVQILATVQDGKITFDINDLLKLIQQDKLTEVKCTVEPKAMAFDTKEELDEYVKNNPNATCKGISKEDLLVFIKENIGKYLFLKEAYLLGADLRGAYLSEAKYDDKTMFSEEFTIPKNMIKI